MRKLSVEDTLQFIDHLIGNHSLIGSGHGFLISEIGHTAGKESCRYEDVRIKEYSHRLAFRT